MRFTLKFQRLFTACIACLLLAGAANASIIVSRPGDPAGEQNILGGLEGDQSLAVSWVQPAANGVSINVYNLLNLGTEDMTVSFSLIATDIINPAIATAPVLVGAGQTLADALLGFGPLDLGAGTYFLTASASGFNGAWLTGSAPGVEGLGTFGSEFFNAGGAGWEETGLGVGYQVQDAAGAVPEPATWLLIGGGLVALAGLLRRRSLP